MQSTNTLHSSTTTISNYRIINTVPVHFGPTSISKPGNGIDIIPILIVKERHQTLIITAFKPL